MLLVLEIYKVQGVRLKTCEFMIADVKTKLDPLEKNLSWGFAKR